MLVRLIINYRLPKEVDHKMMVQRFTGHENNDEISNSSNQQTFMGYNRASNLLLPNGYVSKFPAYLMHKAAIDYDVLELFRPLVNRGVHPESISKLLLELHGIKYMKEFIADEQEIRKMKQLNPSFQSEVFSSFLDESKYSRKVLTGRFIAAVYTNFAQSINPHLTKEAKKRGASHLSIDVSYKEAKHLCR